MLGRTHDPDNVTRAVHRRQGITRVNLDLIYGTPGESVADWEVTPPPRFALDPEHVSAYALTVEPGTPLGKAVAAGNRPAPDDDDQAEKYELADDVLTASGRPWYEISNWARLGRSAVTTSSTGARATTPRRLRRPRARLRAVPAASGTSAPRSATWRPCAPGARSTRPRRRGGGARRRRAGGGGRDPRPPHP
ncbi:MAG: hypothetical protein U0W40_13030 [Acidimicrobiia bacterium]